ncbi:MAG: mechanosensitive ion channel family protein [Selenomonadaceae bacterium]|nr:mechanosensitive ion channel family protein [Selenomonadaceae bacterium]
MSMSWIELAQYLFVPVCILCVSLFVGIAINRFLMEKVSRRLKSEESDIKEIFFRAMQGVPISLCLVIGLYWVVNTSKLPESIMQLLSYLLFTSIMFTITRVVERTVSGFINVKFSSSGDASQSTLMGTILKIFIYASGMLIILQYYGISIAPIITAMGVGGMAVALGLQETLANIFAGLQILLSKQIKVNDVIKIGANEGRVVDINWRFTTIMPANEGTVIVIPNKDIAGSTSTNYSRPREDIVIVVPIGVGYESDLEQVERVTVEVAREIMIEVDGYEPMINSEGKDINPLAPVVRYQEFGDSSINFNAVLHAQVFINQYMIKHKFIKAITKRYREEGINIPFPIRTVINAG